MDVQGKLPALFGGRDTGFAFFEQPYGEDACRAGDGTAQAPIAVGTTGASVSVEAIFNGCGYMATCTCSATTRASCASSAPTRS